MRRTVRRHAPGQRQLLVRVPAEVYRGLEALREAEGLTLRELVLAALDIAWGIGSAETPDRPTDK